MAYSPARREERHLMRRRGAGLGGRELKSAVFGFSFGLLPSIPVDVISVKSPYLPKQSSPQNNKHTAPPPRENRGPTQKPETLHDPTENEYRDAQPPLNRGASQAGDDVEQSEEVVRGKRKRGRPLKATSSTETGSRKRPRIANKASKVVKDVTNIRKQQDVDLLETPTIEDPALSVDKPASTFPRPHARAVTKQAKVLPKPKQNSQSPPPDPPSRLPASNAKPIPTINTFTDPPPSSQAEVSEPQAEVEPSPAPPKRRRGRPPKAAISAAATTKSSRRKRKATPEEDVTVASASVAEDRIAQATLPTLNANSSLDSPQPETKAVGLTVVTSKKASTRPQPAVTHRPAQKDPCLSTISSKAAKSKPIEAPLKAPVLSSRPVNIPSPPKPRSRKPTTAIFGDENDALGAFMAPSIPSSLLLGKKSGGGEKSRRGFGGLKFRM